MRTIARSKPRDIFGELKTEEFYVADRRELQSQRAKEVLQEILGPMGIVVEKVLTKDYRFNPEYQKAIQGKKIVLLPVSEGGMNLKTTDINRLIETMGVKALSKKQQ